MSNQLNISKGIDSLKGLISESVKSVSDLSGNAYKYAKKAEEVSDQQLNLHGISSAKRSTSRLENLARIRQRLEERNSLNDNQSVVYPDQEVQSTVEIMKESNLSERAPTSENVMDRNQLREALLAKARSSKSELLKDAIDHALTSSDLLKSHETRQAEISVELIKGRLTIKHYDLNDLIETTHHEVELTKKSFGLITTYGPASFKSEYLMDSKSYRVLGNLPKDIQFDASLETTITLRYRKIEKPLVEDRQHLEKEVNLITNNDSNNDQLNSQIDDKLRVEIKDPTLLSDRTEDYTEKVDNKLTIEDDHVDSEKDNVVKINDKKPIKKIKRKLSKRQVSIDNEVNSFKSEKHSEISDIDVIRQFSRLIVIVDEDTNEELNRFDQDFDVEGRLTKSGFEPFIRNRLSFPEIKFKIEDSYYRSNKEDEIEISLTDSYLLIQKVYVRKINRDNVFDSADEDDMLDTHQSIEFDDVEEQIYFDEVEMTSEREDIQDDNILIRKITRTIELLHHKNGLIDTIIQEVEFIGEIDDNGNEIFTDDFKLLQSIDLYKRLKNDNLRASHDVSTIRVKPTSYNSIERIVVYDLEIEKQEKEIRLVRYVCDDEVLSSIRQERYILKLINQNTGHERRKLLSDFEDISEIEIEGYRYIDKVKTKLGYDLIYERLSEKSQDVIDSLPKSLKSSVYEGEKVIESTSSPIEFTNRLKTHLRRVRSQDGHQVNSFSHTFKVLGVPITEQAIADEVFRQMINEYGEISTSRIVKSSIKVLGPIYSGEGLILKIKQYLYTVNVQLI